MRNLLRTEPMHRHFRIECILRTSRIVCDNATMRVRSQVGAERDLLNEATTFVISIDEQLRVDCHDRFGLPWA